MKNYIWIITEIPEPLRYIFNSLVVASITTFLILFFGGMAAYSLTRFKYRGRNTIMVALLTVSMFPPIALLPAMFLTFRKLGLLNSYRSLIIAHTGVYMALANWILANYCSTLPPEIEEAAKVDGCSTFRMYWHIVLPLVDPWTVNAPV